MKIGPDASAPLKTSLGVENIKAGPDVLGSAENYSESEKDEYGNRRPRYRLK
jgi:hypothetical protein